MTAHKVTVGYQDGSLHPLWVSRMGMRLSTLLGADAIWLPDHFMGFAPKWMWVPEIVPAAKVIHSMDALFDPIPLLTLAALKHRKVWLGTSVTEPIRRHPMSLAQTFVTLDHISKGRAILGIGNGLRENTEPYGLPTDQRVGRLEEALHLIRLLWESGGKPIDYQGKFWTLKDAVFDLPLYRGRPPRLFVGAHFPRMLRHVRPLRRRLAAGTESRCGGVRRASRHHSRRRNQGGPLARRLRAGPDPAPRVRKESARGLGSGAAQSLLRLHGARSAAGALEGVRHQPSARRGLRGLSRDRAVAHRPHDRRSCARGD